MDEFTGWASDLVADVGGRGVVSLTGLVALRAPADGTGLTGLLSAPAARSGFVPVHDRVRVLADVAVAIADGARVMSELAVLPDQGEPATAGQIGGQAAEQRSARPTVLQVEVARWTAL